MKAVLALSGLLVGGFSLLHVVIAAVASDAGVLLFLAILAAGVALPLAFGTDDVVRRFGQALFGRADDAAENEALRDALSGRPRPQAAAVVPRSGAVERPEAVAASALRVEREHPPEPRTPTSPRALRAENVGPQRASQERTPAGL